jgi:hypothetical protein
MALAVSGCLFRFEKESPPNVLPNTYFDIAPPDTTFVNEVSFLWVGTDLDSDVVAYQFQLVETDAVYFFSRGTQGSVIRSIVPRSESGAEQWVDRTTDDFETFLGLDDGWYEFRARSIDARGAVDDSPARKQFYVFFDDIPPLPEVRPIGTNIGCGGRIAPLTGWTFAITASDASRSSTTPRSLLEYSVQLRAESANTCSEHLADSFTEWRRFPTDDIDDLVIIGDQPPTVYQDLFSANCTWNFTLRVRDPAGLIAAANCSINTNQ